jgi:hypothetical protein
MTALEKILSPMEPRVSKYFEEGRALLLAGTLKEASLKFRIAENLLRVMDRYRQSLSELFRDVAGLPIESFSPAFEQALRPGAGAPIPISLREKTAGANAFDPDVLLRQVDLGNDGKRAAYAGLRPSATRFRRPRSDGDLDVYLFDRAARPLLRNNLTDLDGCDGRDRRRAIPFVPRRRRRPDRDGDPDLVA